MDRKKIQRIKLMIAIFVVIIIAGFVTFRIIKYQAEGEKNMPFNLSKVIIVSTVTTEEMATDQVQNSSVWNFKLIQNNDVYISFDNNAKKDEKLKNITIQNIQIVEAPKVGSLKMYMPNSLDGNRYKYTDDFLVTDSLTYRGSDENNYKNLQISRNGGNIGFSFANSEVGTYSSGEDTEIAHNGTLLTKVNLSNEDVKSKVSFDIIIELDDGKKYSGNLTLDINCNELAESGMSKNEITDFSNVIFKRI